MSAKTVKRNSKKKPGDIGYTCARYIRSGPSTCLGVWINERELINAVLLVMTELLQRNLCQHLMNASAANPVQEQMEGEIKAEPAKVDQGMKNLLEAVKQGALSAMPA